MSDQAGIRTAGVMLSALVTFFFSGCAATIGALGGGYQREIQSKEAEINRLSREHDQLQAHLDRTLLQRENLKREASDLRHRLDLLNESLAMSRRLISSERVRQSVDKKTLDGLIAEQNRLDVELRTLRARAQTTVEHSNRDGNGSAELETKLEADLRDAESRVATHNALVKRFFGMSGR